MVADLSRVRTHRTLQCSAALILQRPCLLFPHHNTGVFVASWLRRARFQPLPKRPTQVAMPSNADVSAQPRKTCLALPRLSTPERTVLFIIPTCALWPVAPWSQANTNAVRDDPFTQILLSQRSVKNIVISINAEYFGTDWAETQDMERFKGTIKEWKSKSNLELMVKWEGWDRCKGASIAGMLGKDERGKSLDVKLEAYESGAAAPVWLYLNTSFHRPLSKRHQLDFFEAPFWLWAHLVPGARS